ncbi:hypothetical protein Hanom_Chr14g01319511 [Helianthus anomalus]
MGYSRGKPISKHVQRQFTKFFITSLPDQCSGNDLAGFAREHTEIYDIYIAHKRDRFRNRFCLVSLLDVKKQGRDGEEFEQDSYGSFRRIAWGAVVAKLADVDALKNIFVIMKEISSTSGKVQFLGGLTVQFSFENSQAATIALEATKDIIGMFSLFCCWAIWKDCPKANTSEEEKDLPVEFVGVLVNDGRRVSEEVVIQWQGRNFRVWVEEVEDEWLPEFVSDDVRSEIVTIVSTWSNTNT